MKLIEKSILLGFILTLLISVTGFKAQCESIEKKVLRLHVIANSDSQEDQDLKLKVRDRILNYSESVFTDASNKNEAEIIINRNLKEIENIAQNEVYLNGYSYQVKVELSNTHFNTRIYKDVTLPAGNYDALKVIIGEGRGKNWWCVMFPPMCLPAAEEKEELSEVLDDSELEIVSDGTKYELKFKVVEIFENLKDIFESWGC